MYNISLQIPKGRKIIEKYGDGRFTISGEEYKGSVVIYPDKVVLWDISNEDMGASYFDYIYSSSYLEEFAKAEIVILGTGAERFGINKQFDTAFRENNVHLEIMDTGAACRTYNVLLAEGRAVIAALVSV